MGKLKTQESTANTCLDNIFGRTVSVLYVDDDLGLLSTTKQILELQNIFRVEIVSTVREAMKKIAEQNVDVIVSDYQMPEKDGLTFLKELREAGFELPFILFTGKGREEVAIKALNIGADYYINKLGHPETVYPQLSHYILQAANKQKAEQMLTHQLEFESVISRISSRFVNPPNFDAAINQSLADIGQVSSACRAYLFKLCENGTFLRNTHEWCNVGVTPKIENLKHLPCELYPYWMKKLYNNQIIQVPDVSLMSPEAKAEKELVLIQDIKSILLLPVNVSGELAGFLGFDNVLKAGFWSSEDVSLLQIVAEILGNSLERRQTYEKLKENERTYRLLTENITDVIFIQNLDLSIRYASPPVEVLSGYTPEEVKNLGPRGLMTPESFEHGVVEIQADLALAAQNQDYEPPFRCYEYVCKDGSTRWGEFKPKLLRDYNGNIVAIQGTLRDVTERKKVENKLRETLKEMEITNEKLSVVGRLSRHDVRNKLSAIANNIYLAKQQLAGNKDPSQNFDAVDSAIDEIEHIFLFVRTYEQLGLEELCDININNCVGEAISLFSDADCIKFVVGCSGLTVFADSLLRQVFYNLIDDSLKHGEKVSQIKVYCEKETDYLKLIYEDDGIGIPENEKALVFKEGYGKDTGYGLYLIRKICEAYGWSIEEIGTFGNGVKFVITIPKFINNRLLYKTETD